MGELQIKINFTGHHQNVQDIMMCGLLMHIPEQWLIGKRIKIVVMDMFVV